MPSRPIQIAAALFVSVAVGSVGLVAQGPLPGDVAATRGLQALFGGSPGWARLLTESARAPGLWATLLLAIGLAAARGGRPAMLAPPLALALAQLADRGLRAFVFAPRPDPALVQVASPGAGSGLPSTFALVYGALFGAVLFVRVVATDGAPTRSVAVASIASGLITAGCTARIVLGGHWTSQVVASLSLAFAIALLVEVVLEDRRGRRERRRSE